MPKYSVEKEVQSIPNRRDIDACDIRSYASKLRRGVSPVCVASLLGFRSIAGLDALLRSHGYNLSGYPIDNNKNAYENLDYNIKYKNKSHREFTKSERDYIYEGIKNGRSLSNLLTDLDLPVRVFELEQAKAIKAQIEEESSRIIPIKRGGLMPIGGDLHE